MDDAIDLVLRQAIGEMREGCSVPPDWRAELLAKLPARPRRRPIVWWVPAGLAATLCLGVGLTVAMRSRAGSVANANVSSRTRFSIRAPGAERVSLVGDFDHWDPAAMPMRRSEDGDWTVDVHLPPGRHVFAYAVDGDLKTDPAAPRAVEDDFGVPSSVIVVATTGGTAR
jgi:hypothetical protein